MSKIRLTFGIGKVAQITDEIKAKITGIAWYNWVAERTSKNALYMVQEQDQEICLDCEDGIGLVADVELSMIWSFEVGLWEITETTCKITRICTYDKDGECILNDYKHENK